MNCLMKPSDWLCLEMEQSQPHTKNRKRLFRDAAELIVKNAYKYYEEGDDSVLPRSIATRQAFLNAMTLDIAMGGSTNTVLHLLAVAHEAEVGFQDG